jgi:hypothetical protein
VLFLKSLTAENLFYIFVIILQLLVVLVFGLTTRLSRFKRRAIKKQQSELMTKWSQIIVDSDLGISSYDKVSCPQGEEYILLQPVLIDFIKSLGGTSRTTAIEIYKKLGYLDNDHYAIEYERFEKRIAALSRIETVQDKSSIPFVRKLQNDENYYIRFAALRFLVKNDWDSVQGFEQRLNELGRKKQYDTMFEVICNLAFYQKSIFERALTHADHPETKRVFLKVVAQYKMTGSLPYVRESLEQLIQQAKFDTGLLKMHLLCLTTAADAETEELFKKLSKHSKQEVRYLAQCSLFVIRPDLKKEILSSVGEEDKAGLQQAFENFATSLGKVIYG